MTFASNILKEFRKQMALELWEDKKVLPGLAGVHEEQVRSSPSPFLSQKLAMLRGLRHGCLNVREP